MTTEQRVEIYWFVHLFVISLGLLHFNPVKEGAVGIPEITSIVREAKLGKCVDVPMYQCNNVLICTMAAGSGQVSLSPEQLGLQCQRWPAMQERGLMESRIVVKNKQTSLFPPTPLFASRIFKPTLLEKCQILDGCSTASFKWTGLDWMGISGWYRAPYCGE